MNPISRLEDQIEKQIRRAPRLPRFIANWLADNIWWMIAILAITWSLIALFAAIGLIGVLFNYASIAKLNVDMNQSNGRLSAILLSLISSVILVLLSGGAIRPLRDKRRRGWVYLFLIILILAAQRIISAALSLNVGSVVGAVFIVIIELAISFYFIFQIRDHFRSDVKVVPRRTTDFTRRP